MRETEGDELTETEKREAKEERQTQTEEQEVVRREVQTDQLIDEQKQWGRHTNKERERRERE